MMLINSTECTATSGNYVIMYNHAKKFTIMNSETEKFNVMYSDVHTFVVVHIHFSIVHNNVSILCRIAPF